MSRRMMGAVFGALLPAIRMLLLLETVGMLGAMEPAAPLVVTATIVFEAVVGYQLMRLRRISGTLRWAQAWVLGLVPALPWPYWVPNAVSAVVFEAVRRGARAPVSWRR